MGWITTNLIIGIVDGGVVRVSTRGGYRGGAPGARAPPVALTGGGRAPSVVDFGGGPKIVRGDPYVAGGVKK